MTYVGELGWELLVPNDAAIAVFDALHERGADLGLADAGYSAIESLRLEKGFRAFGRELTPDYTPLEAGLCSPPRWRREGLPRPRGAGRPAGAAA